MWQGMGICSIQCCDWWTLKCLRLCSLKTPQKPVHMIFECISWSFRFQSRRCYFHKLDLNFVRSQCNKAQRWRNTRPAAWERALFPVQFAVGHDVRRTNWHRSGVADDWPLQSLPWSTLLKHAWFLQSGLGDMTSQALRWPIKTTFLFSNDCRCLEKTSVEKNCSPVYAPCPAIALKVSIPGPRILPCAWRLHNPARKTGCFSSGVWRSHSDSRPTVALAHCLGSGFSGFWRTGVSLSSKETCSGCCLESPCSMKSLRMDDSSIRLSGSWWVNSTDAPPVSFCSTEGVWVSYQDLVPGKKSLSHLKFTRATCTPPYCPLPDFTLVVGCFCGWRISIQWSSPVEDAGRQCAGCHQIHRQEGLCLEWLWVVQ